MNSKLLKRILWQVNRSPLRFLIKWFLRLFYAGEVQKRIKLASELQQTPDSLSCAEHIANHGYAVLTGLVDAELLTEVSESAQKKISVADRAAANQSQVSKNFWIRLLDEDMQDGKLPISSPYVKFATQPIVTQILANAFGEIPRLDYVLLTLSRYSGGEIKKSQLWHFDHDDVRVVKLFIYLSDVVDDLDGPFTFIPAEVSDRYGYNIKSHRTDDEIFGCGLAKPSDAKKMFAPALSVFMVETTRCLHMGSRLAPEHTRLLYTATFAAIPCMFPSRKNNFIKDIEIKDSAKKALLDL